MKAIARMLIIVFLWLVLVVVISIVWDAVWLFLGGVR